MIYLVCKYIPDQDFMLNIEAFESRNDALIFIKQKGGIYCVLHELKFTKDLSTDKGNEQP